MRDTKKSRLYIEEELKTILPVVASCINEVEIEYTKSDEIQEHLSTESSSLVVSSSNYIIDKSSRLKEDRTCVLAVVSTDSAHDQDLLNLMSENKIDDFIPVESLESTPRFRSQLEKWILRFSPEMKNEQLFPHAILDKSFRILRSNELFRQLIQFSVKNVQGKKLDDLNINLDVSNPLPIAKDGKDNFTKLEKGSSIETIATLENEVHRRYLKVNASPALKDGRYSFIFQEITGYVRSEQALIRNNEMLTLAQYMGGLGYWKWNLDDDEMEYSYKFRELLGIENANQPYGIEEMGRFVNPSQRERFERFMDRLITEGEAFSEIFKLNSPQRRAEFVKTVSAPLQIENGRVKSVFGIAWDITEMIRGKEELRRTEERLKHYIEGSTDMVFALDGEGVVKYSTSNVAEVLGFKPKEVEGRHFSEFVHPEDLKRVLSTFKEGMENPGKHIMHSYRGRTKSQGYIWLQANGVVKKIGEDEIEGVTVVRDIDQQVARQKRIEQLSIVADKSTNAVIITNSNRKIEWVNQGFERMSGYTLREVIGQGPGEILQGPESEKYEIAKLSNILQQEESGKAELINYKKSGEPYWIEIFVDPIFNDAGELTNFVAIENDVTERKTLEQNLISRASLQSILLKTASSFINLPLEELESGIYAVLKDVGKFVKADRAYIFDYDFHTKTTTCTVEWCNENVDPAKEQLQEVPLSIFPSWVAAHKKKKPVIIDRVEDMTNEYGERDMLKEQGIKSLITVPIAGDQELYGFLGFDAVKNQKMWSNNEKELLSFLAQVFVNALLRKEYVQTLQKTVDITLGQKDRLQNFAYIVSHNLRSHSANIQGLLDQIDLEYPDELQEILKYLKKSSQGLNETLENLNTLLNVEKNRDVQTEFIDVKGVVDKIIDSLEEAIGSTGARINLKIPENFQINFYLPYFDSIVYNIISNAIKYRKQNVPPEIEIKAFSTKKYDYLEFTDEGRGIDLKRHGKKIFQMYQTFHGNPDARGIGLFMSQKQMEALGGMIEVESFPGAGSTFTLKFPK